MLKELENIKTRPGTWDEVIVNEIGSYKRLQVEGKVVLDIGGCFGAASVYFAKRGAKQVVCYEPEPNNFKMVIENTKDLNNVIAVNSAVHAKSDETITFYANEKGTNKGIGSVFPVRGRKEIKVNTISFDEELEKYRPEVLKIDCEGGEYTFLTKPLPDFVKEVCMEIHMTNDELREKGKQLVELFKDWECIKQPRVEKSQVTIAHWRR